MTFDISKLEITDTADYHVTDAAGNPQFDGDKPITITIYGQGSAKAIKAQHTYTEKTSARTAAVMHGKTQKGAEEAKIADRADFLASITVSLNGFTYGGKAGFEAYKALYSNPKLGHIADGVEKTYIDRGNFMQSSAMSLPSQ